MAPCWLCCREDAAGGAGHGAPFEAQGGLFADEAIQLLQQFYVAGNPTGEQTRNQSSFGRLRCGLMLIPGSHNKTLMCVFVGGPL